MAGEQSRQKVLAQPAEAAEVEGAVDAYRSTAETALAAYTETYHAVGTRLMMQQ